MDSLHDFKKQVRAQHSDAFQLHQDIAVSLEKALISPRDHSSALTIALDMLMTQAYKAHHSVRILAEHAHIEDAATITRRLLELAVQAVYIGADSEDAVKAERSSRYIADLWDHLSSASKGRMPANVRNVWENISNTIPPLPPGRRRWGPRFVQMFEYAGLDDTYKKDYSFLSTLAHGSSEEQVLLFSLPTVEIRPTHQVGMLLVFASRYYLAVAEIWNRAFQVIEPGEFTALVERVKA